MTDQTADQHDPRQGGIVPPHILDKLDPTFSTRRDPFYRRDRLAEWIAEWTSTHTEDPEKMAEGLISAGWITSVAPR